MAENVTPMLKIDMTYGGVYAGTSFEFSTEVATHYNRAAARAEGVLEGEFTPFQAGEYFSIACPMDDPWDRDAFLRAYRQLDVRIDDSIELHLAAFPHLFSNDADDVSKIRAVPTYVPKSAMPEGFFGKVHRLELLQDGGTIFGPADRFFHSRISGCVFDHIEDGHGRLVVEIRGDLSGLSKHGQVVFFSDPLFGEPLGATQVYEDGAVKSLPYRLLGKDYVGDVFLFNEGVVVGVEPRDERVVIELHLPNKGTGLAAALFAGHTRDLAYRTDATVL